MKYLSRAIFILGILVCINAGKTQATNVTMPTQFQAGSLSGTIGNSGSNSGTSAWVTDLNGDGRVDFFYHKDGTKDYPSLLANGDQPNGSGYFGTEIIGASRNSNNKVGWTGNGYANWMADINGDGWTDYIYNDRGTDDYWGFIGNGDGTFQTDKKLGTTSALLESGYPMWLVDINGDNRADLVYAANGSFELQVLYGQSNGTLSAVTTVGDISTNVVNAGESQWMADVNGDGRQDYVYRIGTTLYVQLSINGQFQSAVSAVTLSVGPNSGWEWFADVNGDGRADYLFNPSNSTNSYRAALGNADGTFQSDELWGYRSNNVGFGVEGQGFADLNGDGYDDVFYNRDGTSDYLALLSNGQSFLPDQMWVIRDTNTGYGGYAQYIADMTGDGIPEFIYVNNNGKGVYVAKSQRNGNFTDIRLLDILGQGYVQCGSSITGFQDAFNLNLSTQDVTSGCSTGKPIPELIPINSTSSTFPIDDSSVRIMTQMNTPIDSDLVDEMYRVISKTEGVVVLYGYDPSDPTDQEYLDTFSDVFVTNGFIDVTDTTTLEYPYDTITLQPVQVYRAPQLPLTLSLGKSSRGGGLGNITARNQFSGGVPKQEL